MSDKPTLDSKLFHQADPEWKDLLRQLENKFGVGEVLPTHRAGVVKVRINTESGALEYRSGKAWKPIGAAPSTARGSVPSKGSALLGNESQVFPVLVVFLAGADVRGDILCNGNVDGVDVSAHAADADAHHAQGHTTGSHSDWPGAVSMTEVGYLDNASSEIQAQLNAKLPVAGPVFTGDIRGEVGSVAYIGDPTADGSWRMRVSGADLITEKRVTGSWVTKHTIAG